MTQDTAHKTQRSERAHRWSGAKGPRTPRTQQHTQRKHTGEQKPSGAGHRTRNTTHQASTPVNRRQVAQDTAHATKHSERAHL